MLSPTSATLSPELKGGIVCWPTEVEAAEKTSRRIRKRRFIGYGFYKITKEGPQKVLLCFKKSSVIANN